MPRPPRESELTEESRKEESDSDGQGSVGSGDPLARGGVTSLFPSELGQPYQRAPHTRTPESTQKHVNAGERLVRLASKFNDALQRPSGGEDDPRRVQSSPDFGKQETHRASTEDGPLESGSPGGGLGRAGEHLNAAVAAVGALPPDVPDDTVIIFDWDDTLFPTWFVSEVVVPCLPTDVATDSTLPEDSPFTEALLEHANTVKLLLTTARSIGRVGIVTLAQRPWVLRSAKRFWPGFEFEEILKELEIPIIYARECLRKPMISQAKEEEGVNIFILAKQAAMLKALKKLYGKRPWTNVISIGDSIVERDAITELLWGRDQETDRTPRCKTVKLMEEPSVEQLRAELMLLGMWLRSMASHAEDFDVVMDDSEQMMLKMHERFCG